MAFRVAAVSSSVSPLFTLEEPAERSATSAPRRLAASVNEVLVRVDQRERRRAFVDFAALDAHAAVLDHYRERLLHVSVTLQARPHDHCALAFEPERVKGWLSTQG